MYPSAIIFDCDGVLVDSERIAIAVEREHLSEVGLVYDTTEYLNRFVGLNNRDFHLALEHDHNLHHDRSLPDGFFEALKEDCRTRFETELTSFEGLETFLQRFDGAVAVASSSARDLLHRKLEITALHGHFDPHIYSGDEVANGKPAPDLFLLASSKLKQTPADCLVIEDSVNGVRAAVAADMNVWGFTGGGHVDTGLETRLREAGAREVFSGYGDMGKAIEAERR